MIKKMTQYLLQRRCTLSLLLMLMLLQPAMAQAQTRIMYARLDRETQTLTLYYDTNFVEGNDQGISHSPLWQQLDERKKIKSVVFDESFKDARPKDCLAWFWLFEALTTIEHLDYLNTSEVDDMRLCSPPVPAWKHLICLPLIRKRSNTCMLCLMALRIYAQSSCPKAS